MEYRVYLIANPAGRRYIGLSENVTTRLAQHNAGASRWTAKYRPWRLLWASHARGLTSARKLENLLKRDAEARRNLVFIRAPRL